MFCDRCGANVQSDHRFCSHCGKEFGSGAGVGFPRRSRVREHIRLLGILWIALAALSAIGGVVLFVLANTLFLHLPMNPDNLPTGWLHPFRSFIGVLILLKAAAAVAVGWGLLNREPWARIVAIVLAFIALFNIPFGTALGIYTLWVLLPSEAESEYHEESRAMTA